MTQLYLAPVDEDWMFWFNRTVEQPVDLTDAPIEDLQGLDTARIWGTTSSSRKRSFFEELESNDVILFYHDSQFFASAHAGRVFENPQAGKWLWNNLDSRFIYTITDYQRTSIPVEALNSLLGYKRKNVPNGFVRVAESRVDRLLTKYSSVDEAVESLK